MRSARILVHGRLASFTVAQARKQGSLSLVGTLGDDSGQSLNISALVRVFFELERGRVLLVAEQVQNLFVVNLEVGAAH